MVKINKIYKHYKNGNTYKVLCIAKYTEDLSGMVIYRNIVTNETWVRPVWEFIEDVEDPETGEYVKRFQEVEED